MLVDKSKPPWRIWSIFRPTSIKKTWFMEKAGREVHREGGTILFN